jgi:hypothetical protein
MANQTSETVSGQCQNTDRELWREIEGDYYADSIHVTKEGAIRIHVGGLVYVKSVKDWHALAGFFEKYQKLQRVIFEFKEVLEHSHR